MLRDLLPGLGGKNCPTSVWPPAPSTRLVLWPPGALRQQLQVEGKSFAFW